MVLFLINSINAQNPLLIPPTLTGPNFNLTIDISKLTKGVYLIKINNTITKFIKH